MAGDSESPTRGLLDTSVFIAREAGRPLGDLPEAAAILVVTIAELHPGVLMAHGSPARARRLRTLAAVQSTFEPLPIDSDVARTFAELVAKARRRGRRPKIMDMWIAATAVTHNLPVYTQGEDFVAIPDVRLHQV
jgi:predicted nucleic acid-binding protein